MKIKDLTGMELTLVGSFAICTIILWVWAIITTIYKLIILAMLWL